MVGVQAYGQVLFSTTNLGTGLLVSGSYNIASATQDLGNVNAGILRVDFVTPFLVPPVVTIQPVRVGVEWASPGTEPFMPDGTNVHREVFPLSPALSVGGAADRVEGVAPVPVLQPSPFVVPPAAGREMPASSKIEIENRLLAHRLLAVERTYALIQFASYLGQVVEYRPQLLQGGAGADDYQRGTINEILFGLMAAGDLNTATS